MREPIRRRTRLVHLPDALKIRGLEHTPAFQIFVLRPDAPDLRLGSPADKQILPSSAVPEGLIIGSMMMIGEPGTHFAEFDAGWVNLLQFTGSGADQHDSGRAG